MTSRVRTARRTAIATGALVAILGMLVGAVSVGAQVEPWATAEAVCDGDVGYIEVEIYDESSERYDVWIDGVLVDEDVTDSDGDVYVYGPYDDGMYQVVVNWYGGETTILVEDVTVDCAADVDPEPVPDEAEAEAEAVAATPRFTG